MRTWRRAILAFVVFLTILASLASAAPASAVTTFCYTWQGHYIYCRICEFYGPNGEYFGFIETCWDRAL